MDKRDIAVLSERGLLLYQALEGDWQRLTGSRFGGEKFSLAFPHDTAQLAKKNSLVLVNAPAQEGLRLGLVTSVKAVTTLESRVCFEHIGEIAPQGLADLLGRVSDSSLRRYIKNIRESPDLLQRCTPRVSARLLEEISNIEDNERVLQDLLLELNVPSQYRDARALQFNAIATALKAFGATDGATELHLKADSLLRGVRTLEDAVIIHDARWLPGWTLSNSDLTGRATFTRRDSKLDVFTANKAPLEELFGVDLIYLHQDHGSLVMLQYKMLERVRGNQDDETPEDQAEESPTSDWIVRIDDQFRNEISRMKIFCSDLEPLGSYRLNPNPFFLKLVRRDASLTSPSYILSLDHLLKLETSGLLAGCRGGLRISWAALRGHYLRADGCIELIHSGYVGSRGATTTHMCELIEAALRGGRAVVAALQTTLESRPEKINSPV